MLFLTGALTFFQELYALRGPNELLSLLQNLRIVTICSRYALGVNEVCISQTVLPHIYDAN